MHNVNFNFFNSCKFHGADCKYRNLKTERNIPGELENIKIRKNQNEILVFYNGRVFIFNQKICSGSNCLLSDVQKFSAEFCLILICSTASIGQSNLLPNERKQRPNALFEVSCYTRRCFNPNGAENCDENDDC